MASWRSNVNLTSEEVRSLPLAHFRSGLSVTVYSVGEVNSADSAMSGSTSGLPSGVFMRNGNTWFMTANEPLSYEPAGSSVVTLSVVPTVSVLPPPPLEPPLSPSLPPHAVSTSAVAATPAVATMRRRLLEPGVIRTSVFKDGGRRTRRRHGDRLWPMEVLGLTPLVRRKESCVGTVTRS